MFDRDEVRDFLSHYASDNYDPAKAHEYYLRNRELKGIKSPPKNESKEQRKARLATSKKQLEARMYSKNQIRNKRKAEVKSNEAANAARMEKLRQTAAGSQKRITDKLNKFLADLNASKPKVNLIPLNPIPPNVSPTRRAFLEKENAKITQQNKAASAKAEADHSKKVASAKKSAGAEMKRVGTELKSAIAKARIDYAAAKKKTDSKFDTISKTEEKNIKANVR